MAFVNTTSKGRTPNAKRQTANRQTINGKHLLVVFTRALLVVFVLACLFLVELAALLQIRVRVRVGLDFVIY